jgi:Asp-tRNA(Asn)/Glu-tRNA(Gln) amidotransferase A subunit family amidase
VGLQGKALYRRFQMLLARYDVIVSPVSPVTPFAWTTPHCAQIDGVALENYYRWVALTMWSRSSPIHRCRCLAASITWACHSVFR